MAEMNKETIEHTKADVEANPGHVANDQLEAMNPDASRPETPTQVKAVPVSKDEEGIASAFGQKAAPAAQSSKPKQKKIAVLTSGGDSAGMNAAGESSAWHVITRFASSPYV
jgi:hypothetical protein